MDGIVFNGSILLSEISRYNFKFISGYLWCSARKSLGPLLFILALNDVGTVIRHSNLLIYADDMKIFKNIDGLNDCALLQSDIKEFEYWCAKNSLYLNAKNVKLSHFHENNQKLFMNTLLTIQHCVL